MANGNKTGKLKIQLFNQDLYLPVSNAKIQIYSTGEPDKVIEELSTDENGISDEIDLEAPPIEYSMSPTDNQPYSEYNIKVKAPDFEEIYISGIQIFENQEGIQNIELIPETESAVYNPIIIDAHTLWKEYPSKIPENEVKTLPETGEIVLSKVVIPETIVVHDGVPTDSSAKNYYVKYKDYIKNVASNEIYSTWPDASIRANILAIMSFTLNRVYTEWYRGKGYDFTITSNTAFDQKWIYGKTIYKNISQIVDEQFANYLSKPNVTQPLFTQYCDGKRVTCPNWMTQWGSKKLADDGLSTIEILKYFYGNNIYINTTTTISGIPSSYPGYVLSLGMTGSKVSQIQSQLSRISKNYPAIGNIISDGIYGQNTEEAVKKFQSIFNLPVTGNIDYKTWYKISQIYVGVTKIAEKI